MRLAAMIALSLLATMAAPAPSEARRAAVGGGEASVYLGNVDLALLANALETTPLVEPRDRRISPDLAAAWPTIGEEGARSRFLAGLVSSDAGRLWTLVPHGDAKPLAGILAACLSGSDAWPARALRAAGTEVTVGTAGERVTLSFSSPVGAVLALLRGCASPDGPFLAAGDSGWTANPAAAGGRPHLDTVTVVTTPGEAALLAATSGAAGELLVAPWPDVWLLVPDEAAKDADPLDLGVAGEGLSRFSDELAADLILAVHRGGRGAATTHLLPPGVAPARSMAVALGRAPAPPLTLLPLPADAPSLRVAHQAADELAGALLERLALLLRARGWAVTGAESKGAPAAHIVRWRPSTPDTGLALLTLAADLDLPLPPDSAEGLLSATRAERTSAALTIERQWLDARLVVPLLTAERTLTVSPRLVGVRVRGDGAPVLDDAWWVSP
ncbi:MAG: hypothetical protein KDA24_09820 [Deltaproteobacteria bacterium]|nr:hypothetical protein [Deltaproteobacteria bacterium]